MKSLWRPREAARCKDKLDRLVYRSRLIGSEPKLCVWGGGNTSTKTVERDHLGRMRRVLRIKGSGSDLKASTRRDFPPAALDDLLEAFKIEKMTDEEMVDFVSRSLLDPKAPRPSIEVLLHAFIDQPDIDHTHADAILSITDTRNGKKIARRIFGDELLWVPYVKPGFTLAQWAGEACRKNPEAKGVILEKHGLMTWGPDAKTSYARTIEMVTRAEKYIARAKRKKSQWSPPVCKSLAASEKLDWILKFLPVIRRAVSSPHPNPLPSRGEGGVRGTLAEKKILFSDDSPAVMEFVNAKAAARVSQIGPATPDHMLRTRRMPLYVKGDVRQLTEKALCRKIDNYARQHERYFRKYKHLLLNQTLKAEGSRNQRFLEPLDPYPKVILIPGIGMITTGKTLKDAKIVAEIYEHSISVMKAAETIDRYESLSERLAFEMDYWPLELYKLSLAPPEAEFSRQVGIVTGAARGIGRAIAARLAAGGAHVYLADLNLKAVEEAADFINEKSPHPAPLPRRKRGKPPALRADRPGGGEGGMGRAFALKMDVTSPKSVQEGFKKILFETGGLDFVVSNAGIAHVAAVDELELKDWEKSLAVNATGHFLVAREAVRIMKRQGMGGALVFIASKNVLVPGKDFGAYSAAKAAETQLARILAIECGGHLIRVNIIHPDGVFEDSGLWEKIGPERARSYGIAAARLPQYYVNRNLMKTVVHPEDVAEAAAFLISSRSSKTTGCMITVDGGVKEAFPR